MGFSCVIIDIIFLFELNIIFVIYFFEKFRYQTVFKSLVSAFLEYSAARRVEYVGVVPLKPWHAGPFDMGNKTLGSLLSSAPFTIENSTIE